MLCEGQVVVAIHDVHSEAEGCLQLWQGGELEVLYVGSGVREEEGWIYGQKIYGKEEGWCSYAESGWCSYGRKRAGVAQLMSESRVAMQTNALQQDAYQVRGLCIHDASICLLPSCDL